MRRSEGHRETDPAAGAAGRRPYAKPAVRAVRVATRPDALAMFYGEPDSTCTAHIHTNAGQGCGSP